MTLKSSTLHCACVHLKNKGRVLSPFYSDRINEIAC